MFGTITRNPPRPGRRALLLALLVCCMPAAVRASEPTRSSVALEAPASKAVGDIDVLSQQAPGREAVLSLRNSLVTPTAATRWKVPRPKGEMRALMPPSCTLLHTHSKCEE